MSDHSDLLDRFAKLQEDTISGSVGFTRESAHGRPPYWTNFLGPAEFGIDGDEQGIEIRTVRSRLIVGHFTEGYDGEVEDDLYEYVSQWHQAISDSDQVLSTTYTTAPTYLHARGVELVGDSGLDYFLVPGVPHVQVGIEFEHTAYMFEAINV